MHVHRACRILVHFAHFWHRGPAFLPPVMLTVLNTPCSSGKSRITHARRKKRVASPVLDGRHDERLHPGNPAAEAFRLAAGNLGYRLFGLALFAAGTTSVVGAAYTSVSFLKTLHPFIMKNERWFIVGFIAFSTLVMALVGSPAKVLILVGALNGLILPISLGIILIASRNKKIVGETYKHPVWLIALGVIVVCLAAYLGITTFVGNLGQLI